VASFQDLTVFKTGLEMEGREFILLYFVPKFISCITKVATVTVRPY